MITRKLKERVYYLNFYAKKECYILVDFIRFIENNSLHLWQEYHVPSSVFPNQE